MYFVIVAKYLGKRKLCSFDFTMIVENFLCYVGFLIVRNFLMAILEFFYMLILSFYNFPSYAL